VRSVRIKWSATSKSSSCRAPRAIEWNGSRTVGALRPTCRRSSSPYSLLTGSQRIGHENLKLRDPLFVESYERWAGEFVTERKGPRPPHVFFCRSKLRGMDLPNRVVVSPMAQYCAVDGVARRLAPRSLWPQSAPAGPVSSTRR